MQIGQGWNFPDHLKDLETQVSFILTKSQSPLGSYEQVPVYRTEIVTIIPGL